MAVQNNDDDGLLSFLRREALIGRIQVECKSYLNGEIFQDQIISQQNEHEDQLELYADGSLTTIQKIFNQNQQTNTIHLRNTPTFLPIVISQIIGDNSSYIIPSYSLDIRRLQSYAPKYQLEAVICNINQHNVIFMRDLHNNRWYYYQENKDCQELGQSLSQELDYILQSTSTREQRDLIRSAHFLISMIFFNATKYIYKQET